MIEIEEEEREITKHLRGIKYILVSFLLFWSSKELARQTEIFPIIGYLGFIIIISAILLLTEK